VLVVAACDLPDVDGPTVRALLRPVLDGRAGVTVAETDVDVDGRQPLLGAWRAGKVERVLARAFASGTRSMHEALAALDAAGVEIVAVTVDRAVLRNVNHPDDLAR
jgi:molybdopterin-guanine dinucleotide biosynthesis protein A